jgi:hypothetical protein
MAKLVYGYGTYIYWNRVEEGRVQNYSIMLFRSLLLNAHDHKL